MEHDPNQLTFNNVYGLLKSSLEYRLDAVSTAASLKIDRAQLSSIQTLKSKQLTALSSNGLWEEYKVFFQFLSKSKRQFRRHMFYHKLQEVKRYLAKFKYLRLFSSSIIIFNQLIQIRDSQSDVIDAQLPRLEYFQLLSLQLNALIMVTHKVIGIVRHAYQVVRDELALNLEGVKQVSSAGIAYVAVFHTSLLAIEKELNELRMTFDQVLLMRDRLPQIPQAAQRSTFDKQCLMPLARCSAITALS